MDHGEERQSAEPCRGDRFDTTQWSMVYEAAHAGSAGADEALAALCRRYWPPLLEFARRRGYTEGDAQDLTQSFFAAIIGRNALASADPTRGRFRTFLLSSFVHFMHGERAKSEAAKRGGGERIEDWDDEKSGEVLRGHRPELSAHESFDRSWAEHLFGLALERLAGEYKAADQEGWFSQLRPFLSLPGDGVAYAEVASQFGVKPDSVNVAVHRLRRRLGDLLRAEVRRTVRDPADLEEELRHLVGILAH